jgi:hypothetical protein
MTAPAIEIEQALARVWGKHRAAITLVILHGVAYAASIEELTLVLNQPNVSRRRARRLRGKRKGTTR